MATKRILVVDDEEDVLNALARALEISGYRVAKALSAKRALELCTDGVFDLIVVDFIMPGKSGLVLLNEIRKEQPTIRSIVVSGKVDPQLKEDEVKTRLKVELEADQYFNKPVSNDRLLEAVNRLLRESEAQDWPEVAERFLNAKKTKTKVQSVEKGLKRRPGGVKKE